MFNESITQQQKLVKRLKLQTK